MCVCVRLCILEICHVSPCVCLDFLYLGSGKINQCKVEPVKFPKVIDRRQADECRQNQPLPLHHQWHHHHFSELGFLSFQSSEQQPPVVDCVSLTKCPWAWGLGLYLLHSCLTQGYCSLQLLTMLYRHVVVCLAPVSDLSGAQAY